MARNTKKQSNNPLLNAINFLSLCQSKAGSEMHVHCSLYENKAVAFNGVVAIGQTIIEDIEACPNTFQLAAALEQCGETFALIKPDEERVLVRSGDFQAFIPCCDREKLPQAAPDAALTAISEDLTRALAIVAPLANKKASTVVAASVQVAGGSVIATNRVTILEAWHGLNLPDMLLPKSAVEVLLKCGKKVKSFGYSGKTATFWFEDDSWMRTQLYQDGAKDLIGILNQPQVNRRKVPEQFFSAVSKVAAFSSDGNVYCRKGYLSSHRSPDVQGSKLNVEIEGGPVNVSYEISELKYLEKYANEYDDGYKQFTLFFSPTVRGAIWHEQLAEPLPPCATYPCPGCDNCIPF